MPSSALPIAAPPTNLPVATPVRIDRSVAIDLLRGLVMALMVLDHARDFFGGFGSHATDLAQTTPALFLTRWITHFCAPTFLLLAGLGAALFGRKRAPAELRYWLWTRGLWLVILEIVVVRLGWIPDPLYRFTLLQVIWATGWSMLLLAAICTLPPIVLGMLAVTLGALHPLLLDALSGVLPAWLDTVLLGEGMFEPFAGHKFRLSYAILPWFAVLTFGFSLGALWLQGQAGKRRLGWLGALLVVAFVAMRALGVGDPQPFVAQGSWLWSSIAWLNCDKYPPSPAYLAMTLGPALIALSLLPAAVPRWLNPLVTYGRVPLFFYVVHLYLLRWTSIPLAFAAWGKSAMQMPPQGHGLSPQWPLWAIYLVWIATLLLLVRPSAWWAGKKARGRGWWWSYL